MTPYTQHFISWCTASNEAANMFVSFRVPAAHNNNAKMRCSFRAPYTISRVHVNNSGLSPARKTQK